MLHYVRVDLPIIVRLTIAHPTILNFQYMGYNGFFQVLF